MPSDARLRELEAERDAAIRERDEATKRERHTRAVLSAAERDYGCRLSDRERERDAAVAACAAMRAALETAGHALHNDLQCTCCLDDTMTEDPKCRHHAALRTVRAALSAAPGARLLEEVRLLRAFVSAVEEELRAKASPSRSYLVNGLIAATDCARDELRRFDEETRR